MALHFNIGFRDLSYEMQEEITASVRDMVKDELQTELVGYQHDDGNEHKTFDELSEEIWYQSFDEMIDEKTDDYINRNFYCRAEV